MTDTSDETGKGSPRAGDAPRRPHATIELKATEIGRAEGARSGGGAELPPPEQGRGEGRGRAARGATWGAAGGRVLAALLSGLAGTGAAALRLARNSAFFTHMAAGVAGAALTLAVGGLLGAFSGARVDTAGHERRLAAAEATLAQRAGDTEARLAVAERRLATLDEQAQALAALRTDHARLAAEIKSGASEQADRVARLEELAAAGAAPGTGEPTPGQLATRLAAVEERLSAGADGGDARAAAGRAEHGVAAVKTETAGLRHELAAVKDTLDRQVRVKLAALERDLQAARTREGERLDGAQQSLLTLELASVRRALDRGESFAGELAAAKAAAGGAIDLSGLDRAAATGVPTLPELAQAFPRVADRAIDAERDAPDASVLDRLIAGARSVVRVRKTQHDAADTSVEATLWRMETALKAGDTDAVLAQGKRLPAKAAQVAADWLQRLEARQAADRTVAEAEAALKASLARRPPATEPSR